MRHRRPEPLEKGLVIFEDLVSPLRPEGGIISLGFFSKKVAKKRPRIRFTGFQGSRGLGF